MAQVWLKCTLQYMPDRPQWGKLRRAGRLLYSRRSPRMYASIGTLRYRAAWHEGRRFHWRSLVQRRENVARVAMQHGSKHDYMKGIICVAGVSRRGWSVTNTGLVCPAVAGLSPLCNYME